MNKRNINLDLIKSLACIGVVGLHSVGMINYTIYYLCTFSVPFFFMVNGYLMFKKEHIDYIYAGKKILELLKIVFAYNLLIMLPVMIFRHKLINPITFSVRSMLQQGYLWHFWFFGALLVMYILLPIVFKLLYGRRVAHLCTVLLLAGVCIGFNVYSSLTGYPIQAFVPQSLRVWTWLFYFLAGGFISKYFNSEKITSAKIIIGAILVIALTVVANTMQKRLGLFYIHHRSAEFFYDDGVVMIWILLAFLLFICIKVPEKLSKPVSIFSSLSLGIFIFHPLLLNVVGAVIDINSSLKAVVVWICMIVVSGLITFVMSKIPFVKEFVKV